MKIFLVTMLVALKATAFCATQHAYVTELGSNSVSIIDVDRNTVQKIFGFSSPHTIRVTFDGTAAYVGDNDNGIYKINCWDNTVTKVATLSGHPISFCIVPDASYLYCATHNDTVAIVDLNTHTLVTEIACLNGPQDIRCTLDGKFVYVTNKGNGTISVIDTNTQMLVKTIEGFKFPVGITFDLNGNFAYISDSHDNLVYVISMSDHTIVDKILGFSKPSYIAMDPDKNTAYISNTGNDTISVLRLSDHFITNTVPVPRPTAISVTLDGLYLYVASSLTDIIKLNIIDQTIESVIPELKNPSNISISFNNGPADSVNAWQVVSNPTAPYNQIAWEKPAGNPSQYRIFRDSRYEDLITTIPGSSNSLLYNDEQLTTGQTYSYYVVADYDNGFSSSIGGITVTPDRVGLPR